MIRVGINARALGKPEPAGVSRYTMNLASALAERSSATDDAEFLLFGIDSLPTELREYNCVRNASVSPDSHSGLHAHIWEQFGLARAIERFDLDVFHTPAGQPPVLATLTNVPLVTTIHDLSHIRHPEWFSRSYSSLYRVLTPLAVRTSAQLIAVSQFTHNEIADMYSHAVGKTTTVHNGVTPPKYPGSPFDSLDGVEFLLFVGGANRRKNLSTLVSAYQEYRTQTADPVALVLAGPNREVFADVGYDEPTGVHTLGYVSDEELGWLYRSANVFVYPALYEGFGLPIIEAMHAGTPVITSNQGAMAEVADDAAQLVDPLDPSMIAASVEYILTNRQYRERLIHRGRERAALFTWARTAERTLAVYRAAAEQ